MPAPFTALRGAVTPWEEPRCVSKAYSRGTTNAKASLHAAFPSWEPKRSAYIWLASKISTMALNVAHVAIAD